MVYRIMEDRELLAIALRHKKWLISSGLLIVIIGVLAAAYVGEAVQFRQGGLTWGSIKITLESASTLVIFLILAGFVFYLGSGTEIDVEHPKEGKTKIRIRRIVSKQAS